MLARITTNPPLEISYVAVSSLYMRAPSYHLFALLFPLFSVGQTFVQPQPNEAFLQSEVAEVHITVSQSDINTLLGDSLFSDHHFPGYFAMKVPPFQIPFKT